MEVTPKIVAAAIAAGCLVVGIAAGVADWRHRKRRELDRVALLDWRTVQVFALMGAMIIGALAIRL